MHKAAGTGSGVVGDRSVRFEGWGDDTVSSHDSRQGPDSLGGAEVNLSVRTNEKKARAISLIGGVTIVGDIILGPESDPEETLWMTPKAWSSIRGSVTVATVKLPLEPVEIPLLSDSGRLWVSGHEAVTLPGGLYRFRDIRISGKGQLVFTGPTQVYVEQDMEIGGNGISTTTNLPSDLAFYIKGERVSISGNANLFAKLNAPYAAVDISTRGSIYGMIIGRDVVIHGSANIQYDEALNIYDEALNPPGKTEPVQIAVLSWREVDP